MLSSSSSFLTSQRGRRQINDLPEEILEEILSRVPAKYVLGCRSVCRMWKALTSTENFGELHHLHHHRNPSSDDFTLLVEEMARPIIIEDNYKTFKNNFKFGKKLYIFDGWRGENKAISPRQDYSYIDAYEDDDDGEDESKMFISGSYCGLVVLHHKPRFFGKRFSRNFIIMNPIFPDNKVKIKVAESSKMIGQIFGVFFHPVLQEFCVLWGQTRQTKEYILRVVEGYKLLNLGPSQSRWRNINNQSTLDLLKKRKQPRIEICSWSSMGVTSPIVLDDVLYWMVDERPQLEWRNGKYVEGAKFCEEAILGFDTKTEEFHLLPHPACIRCEKDIDEIIVEEKLRGDAVTRGVLIEHFHGSMHLLENNRGRHLSLCQFSEVNGNGNGGRSVSIWIFKKDKEDDQIPNSASSASNYYNINKGSSWIKTHTIKLNDHDIIISTPLLSFLNNFRPIAMIDDELLLLRWQIFGYLFVCNLKLGTCERFESKRGIIDNTLAGGIDGSFSTFICAHTHSLIPINNSNHEIILWKE